MMKYGVRVWEDLPLLIRIFDMLTKLLYYNKILLIIMRVQDEQC